MGQPGALTVALNRIAPQRGQSAPRQESASAVPTLFVWGTNVVALGRAAAELTRRWVRGHFERERPHE